LICYSEPFSRFPQAVNKFITGIVILHKNAMGCLSEILGEILGVEMGCGRGFDKPMDS
jgi:hypothetical protein